MAMCGKGDTIVRLLLHKHGVLVARLNAVGKLGRGYSGRAPDVFVLEDKRGNGLPVGSSQKLESRNIPVLFIMLSA